MAVNDDSTDGAQTDLNPFAVKAIREGISEEAERQVKFQTAMRIQGDPDPEATQEFQQELIGAIKQHLTEEDVSLPEAAIALWDELCRMEDHLSDGGEKATDEDDETCSGDDSEAGGTDAGEDGVATPTRLLETDGGDDEEGSGTEADSGADDPAFQ